MTRRCPHCKRLLPDRLLYTTDESWSGVTMLISGLGGVVFAVLWRNGDLEWMLPWHYDVQAEWRMALGSLLLAAILFLEGIGIRRLGLYWMRQAEEGPEAEQVEQRRADRIVTVERRRTGSRSLVRPPAPPYVNEYQLWEVLLKAIARYDDVTLSEETAREKRVVGNREDYRRLLRWLVDEGLYVTSNEGEYDNRNGGELTDWCRQLVAPAPREASANADES